MKGHLQTRWEECCPQHVAPGASALPIDQQHLRIKTLAEGDLDPMRDDLPYREDEWYEVDPKSWTGS